MNQEHFTSPKLSEKLEKLGVESQFDFIWWTYAPEEEKWSLIEFSKYMTALTPPLPTIQKAYHFSDLLLPENAKKIWPEIKEMPNRSGGVYVVEMWTEKLKKLLNRVSGINGKLTSKKPREWKQWLESEVDKSLQQ